LNTRRHLKRIRDLSRGTVVTVTGLIGINRARANRNKRHNTISGDRAHPGRCAVVPQVKLPAKVDRCLN